MERDDRIRVFKETVEAVRNGSYTNGKGESVEIPRVNDGLSIDSVTFYDKDIKKKINFDKLPRYQTEIKVINQDCLYAAKELVDDGFAPAVVNFASFAVPGGGVRKGSRAQEENICRRTNLFESIFRFIDTLAKEYGLPLEDKRYPLPIHHGAIYSPSISVFRASEDKDYAFLDEPFAVDIITIAALKKPELEKGHLNAWSKSITKEKIRTMLNLAIYWENDSIVLGAFGCGAYGNSHKEHNPRGNFVPFKEILEN